jgi:transposase
MGDTRSIDTARAESRAAGKYSKRAILNAIFYLVRSGCAWRMLPNDFAAVEAGVALFCPLEEAVVGQFESDSFVCASQRISA